MKRNINVLVSLLTVVALLTSCGGNMQKMVDSAEQLGFNVTPKVLEMHGDEVEITINGTFPPKYFNKKVVLTATPVLKWDGGEKAFTPKVFQGESVQENNEVIGYDNGGSFTYTDKIAYEEGMRVSQLEIRLSAKMGDKTMDFPGKKIADGVIETPKLVQLDPKPILMTDKFQRIVADAKTADVHYVINQSSLRTKELKSEDIKALKEFLKAAKENERVKVKGLEVSSYASPDGAVDLNTKLAGKREKAAAGYIKKQLKKSKIEEAKEDNFVSVKTTPEDWDGFKELMEKSEIQDKELILRVLSMYSDPVVREKEIKNIAAAYKEVADKVLPKLRRSVFTVSIEKIGYSDDELKELVKSEPSKLNKEELLYSATLTEDLNEKLTIYKKVKELHPDCLRAINNIGYTNILLGKMNDAKVALEEAKEMKADNPIVLNNLGVVAMKEGDLTKAEELFNAATDAGNEVSYNLGIIKIKQADYKTAVTYFKDNVSFNAALALMLAGKMDASKKTLNALGENAMAYYLKAVIGARAENDANVFDNLRTALGLDSELKKFVVTDLEFHKYFENDTFKSLL